MDNGETLYPEAGTPQGGVISPLLMNIALHGLEAYLVRMCPHRNKPGVIRFADDLVIIHEDQDILRLLISLAETWLAEMGLRFKPSKSRIVHMLHEHQGQHPGFDFLGFNARQYPVEKYHTRTFRGKPGFKTLIKPSQDAQKRQRKKVTDIIRKHRGNAQAALIGELNPVIRGWTRYYRSCIAKDTFDHIDAWLLHSLHQWARHRHPHKGLGWRWRRYWKQRDQRMAFTDGSGHLVTYASTKIERHIKVTATKSIYDGDWLYWGARLSKTPMYPKRKTNLLKRQRSKCPHCRLRFMDGNVLEVHHRNGDNHDSRYDNLLLLHGHCHDEVHRSECL